MLKVEPSPDYPTEEGRYLRGNDFSPVAVVVVLIYDEDKIPKDIETLVRTGVEAGAAIMSLLKDGVDERKKIRNTLAPTPYLFNLPAEYIESFRKQIVSVVNLLNRGTPDLVRKAVWSCYQKTPTLFDGQTLYDIGAYPEGPISAKLTWRVTNPVFEPKDESERKQKEGFMKRMEEIKKKVQAKRKS